MMLASGVALLTLAATAPAAPAAPLTYTFAQTGWVHGYGNFGSTLSGTFTGTPEASGFILQGDLTAFTADFEVGGPAGGTVTETFGLPDLTLFSFAPDAFTFAASNLGTSARLCSGAAASFGLCGPGGSISGEFTMPSVTIGDLTILSEDETTTSGATVTLVPATPVPGPASASVLLAGLLGLAAVRRRA